MVGVRHPNVQVDCVTFTAGRTCQHAVNAITNGTLQFHAAVALVGPDCRRLLETASAAINLPVVFVASGEARPSMPPPTAYTIFQPHYVIPDAIGRLLRHLELQHPILVVRQPWSAEQLDFLRGTGPRPQIVIPPDDASTVSSLTTHDPLLTSAAAPSFGPYLDVINEIISAASPLVVIDMYVLGDGGTGVVAEQGLRCWVETNTERQRDGDMKASKRRTLLKSFHPPHVQWRYRGNRVTHKAKR